MKNEKKPWWVIVVAVLILAVHQFGDLLAEKNLILIPVILAFVLAFGGMLVQGLKQWKKPDRETISEYLPISAFLRGSDGTDLKTHAKRFLFTLAFCVFALYKKAGSTAVSAAPWVICGFALLVSGIPLVRSWLDKNRQDRDGPDYKAGALIAIALGLVTCGFMGFFIGIGVYHGVWWFVLPPGLIFLCFFSRPLVAGIRILLHREKDPGEEHINRRRDIDPWDRPDREL